MRVGMDKKKRISVYINGTPLRFKSLDIHPDCVGDIFVDPCLGPLKVIFRDQTRVICSAAYSELYFCSGCRDQEG